MLQQKKERACSNNAAHNEWQCHAIASGNQTENHNRISGIIQYT